MIYFSYLYALKCIYRNTMKKIFVFLLFVCCFLQSFAQTAIDLGLPSGTLWADRNLGATSATGAGGSWQWGDVLVEPSTGSWSNYKWCGGSGTTLTKYCVHADKGTVDGKKQLELEDDVAHDMWGDSWVIPTYYEMKELIENCEFTLSGDVFTVTGPNGKSIKIPATTGMGYSTSTLNEGTSTSSRSYKVTGSSLVQTAVMRYAKCHIRPVKRPTYPAIHTPGEMVDMGLPSGTLWSSTNIGATTPEQEGYFFAWGETEPKCGFGWTNYKYCDGTEETVRKYGSNVGWKYVLDMEDDAARVNWGTDWCMPTYAQNEELVNPEYTTITHNHVLNGQNGVLITSKKNDNTLFFPYTGYVNGILFTNWANTTYIWSRSIAFTGSSRNAYFLKLQDGSSTAFNIGFAAGMPVRPVATAMAVRVTGISVAHKSVAVGGTVTLSATITPSTATTKTVTWSSSNTSIATVNASTGKVTGKAPGSCTITATATDGSGVTGTCLVTVKGVPAAMELVDLGLPSGTMWANMNVGASAPEEYGGYYAWGETETKATYTSSNYKYGTSPFTKYNPTDGKVVLEAADDAASVNWSSAYRMPTKEEMQELIDGCNFTVVTQNGVNGFKVTSKINGKSIFLPAAGYVTNAGLQNFQAQTVLFTSTRDISNTNAHDANAKTDLSNTFHIGSGARYYGRNIRPVGVEKVACMLVDGEPYTNSVEKDMRTITYRRTFKNNNWQAWYVPFELRVKDYEDQLRFAQINNMHQYDTDNDGLLDDMKMEVNYVNYAPEHDRVLRANYPYLVKYTGTCPATVDIVVEDATLYPADEETFTCQSMMYQYDFHSTYATTSLAGGNKYALASGALKKASSTATLGSYRWYMQITERGEKPFVELPSEVRMFFMNMPADEATGISVVEHSDVDDRAEETTFDLQGRRLQKTVQPGIYIVNGRKVVKR